MTGDPNDRLENQPEPQAAGNGAAEPENGSEQGERRKILIGSQRNPDAYRPKPKRDWEPVVEKKPVFPEQGTLLCDALKAAACQDPPEEWEVLRPERYSLFYLAAS